MNKTVAAVGVYLLAAIALVGAVVLAVTSHPVPAELWNIALVLVGGATGIAVSPNSGTTINAGGTTAVPK